MSKERGSRPELARLIAQSMAGETFLVPAQLCSPVMRSNYCNGSVLRVLFGLIWLSSEILRSGAPVRFRASLAEIRVASGFESYGKDTPIIEALACLPGEICDLPDGGEIEIFEKLEILSSEGRTVEWVFTREFSELFISPRVFAIASVSEIAHLKSGLDFFLYFQVRRIWKMQRKSVVLKVQDLARSANLDENISLKRVSERVRRAACRLEDLLQSDIYLRPLKSPGARKYGELRLEVRVL